MLHLDSEEPIAEAAVPAAGGGGGCRCDERRPLRHTSSVFGLLPSFMLAIAPKCPFCWAAYMSALGSVGISIQIPYQPWLLPLMAGLLLVNLAALFSRARARGRYGAFLLCLLGGATITSGKFLLESPMLVALGLGCILAGSLWSASFKKSPRRGDARSAVA
ncbi:MAG: mercuric ion transport protein [Pseudoalteromonas tetraodonis]